MKISKNKKNFFFRAFPALTIIFIIIIALTLLSDKAPPVQPEIQIEPEALNLALPETTPPIITTTPPITTTEPPVTTTTPPTTTSMAAQTATASAPATTTTAPISTTITTTTSPTITAPPPQMPEGAQGIDEKGWYYKIENGQKYVWHSILGWGRDDGVGTVTIMDVQSDGYKFYVEPDGRMNLGKVVSPDGEVITWEEYQTIKESQ